MNKAVINKNLPDRMLYLDAFRGLAIAGILLANNLGSENYVYKQLARAPWHGCRMADLVLPFFLFMVGVSIAFSKRLENATFFARLRKISRRALILFSLGLFLEFLQMTITGHSLLDKFDLVNLRIPGVLQRAALCYFFTALMIITCKERTQYFIPAALLIIYWILLYVIPVPGFGFGNLSLEGNACGYIDRLIIGPAHLSVKDKISGLGIFDPEGILSTIPAIATTMLGYFLGRKLKSTISGAKELLKLIGIGVFMILAALVMGIFLPINKKLWTTSYAVFTAGIAAICLLSFYYFIDIKRMRRGIMPLAYLGANAITAYMSFTIFAYICTYIIRFRGPLGDIISLRNYIYQYLLVPFTGNMMGSLLYGILYMILWIFIMRIFYQRNIFIKV